MQRNSHLLLPRDLRPGPAHQRAEGARQRRRRRRQRGRLPGGGRRHSSHAVLLKHPGVLRLLLPVLLHQHGTLLLLRHRLDLLGSCRGGLAVPGPIACCWLCACLLPGPCPRRLLGLGGAGDRSFGGGLSLGLLSLLHELLGRLLLLGRGQSRHATPSKVDWRRHERRHATCTHQARASSRHVRLSSALGTV